MISKLKIALVAALLAVVAVPTIASTAQAEPNYDRHANHGH
jgi:hypothetical protein